MTNNNQRTLIQCSDKQNIKEWSKLLKKPVTEQEYSEICHNLKGFFDTLREWEKSDNK